MTQTHFFKKIHLLNLASVRRFLKYRLNREDMIIVKLVRDAVTSPTNRNDLITLEIKVGTTLCYLVTENMRRIVYEMHMTISRTYRLLD